MKKRWLAIFILALLCMTVFSASAYADSPRRLELTEITTVNTNGTTTTPQSKPYATWFLTDESTIYTTGGMRYAYTSAAGESGKQILTLEGESVYDNKQIVIDGDKATAVRTAGNVKTTYSFDVSNTASVFETTIESAKQNGTVLDFQWKAENGNGVCTFHYDLYDSENKLVLSGTTTDTTVRCTAPGTDTYRLFVTAVDEDNDVSEYALKEDVSFELGEYSDFVIEDGIVKAYRGSADSITIPADFHGPITAIAANAFAQAGNLEKIELPDSITSIDTRAFSGCDAKIFCTSDKENYVPQRLSALRIPFYDKANDTDGEFALMLMTISGKANTLALYAYEGTDSAVTIPSNVEYIYNDAFKDNKSITAVTVPSAVTGIGANAFSGCARLSTVTFDDDSTLKTIGTNAFYDCGALRTLELPKSLETIGAGAFAECDRLDKLVLYSGNVSSIGNNAFLNCPARVFCQSTGDTTVETVSDLVRTFYYEEGDLTLELHSVLNSETGKREVELYSCTGVGTDLEIPDYVDYINDGAFKDNKALKSVTIPASVKEIRANAFQNCSALETVTISESSALTLIGDYAFNNCAKLGNVELPDSLETIGIHAFSECKAMTEMTLPDNVEAIGANAFFNGPDKVLCDHDAPVAKVVSAMPYTFWDITDKNFGLRWEGNDIVLYDYDGEDDAEVPDYVTAVSPDAFANKKDSLTSVKLPASVTVIPAHTFDGYDKLASIEFAKGTELEDNAILNCQELASVTDMSDDLSVYDTNFDNCPKLLLDLKFDSLLLTLDVDYAKAAKLPFTGTLTKLEYSNGKVAQLNAGVVTAYQAGTTTITIYADGKLGQVEVTVLSGLNGLTLPAALTEIEEEAFNGNSAQYVVLPAGTSSVGKRAFADNTGLRFINLLSDAIAGDAFDGSPNVVAFVGEGSAAESWCADNGITFQYTA